MKKPIIILVHPQLVENIGMTARAMMNCGLEELRLVKPRDPWPLGAVHQKRMAAASAGADAVLEKAKLYDTLEEAIADVHHVYATAGRPHDLVHRVYTARGAMPEITARLDEGQSCALLFGPERTGLTNEHIALASAIISIPLNPTFMSLNLAQAVLVMGYEWYQHHDQTPDKRLLTGRSFPATRDDYMNFFRRLEEELDATEFFVAEDMRPAMVRNLHAVFERAEMTEQEIRTFHGVLTALATGKRRRHHKDKDEN